MRMHRRELMASLKPLQVEKKPLKAAFFNRKSGSRCLFGPRRHVLAGGCALLPLPHMFLHIRRGDPAAAEMDSLVDLLRLGIAGKIPFRT